MSTCGIPPSSGRCFVRGGAGGAGAVDSVREGLRSWEVLDGDYIGVVMGRRLGLSTDIGS